MAYADSLKNKYGDKFTSIENVLTRVRKKVFLSVKRQNKQITGGIIRNLVEEKRLELNLSLNESTSGPKVEVQDRTKNSKIIKKHRSRRNVDEWRNKNKRKYCSLFDDDSVDSEDVASYKLWKQENIENRIPGISVQKVLLMLEELEDDNLNKEEQQLNRCVSFQNNSFNTFWDAIQPILKGLRNSLLTRNWDNMTCLLLMLLNKHRAALYMPVIKTLCEIMLEYNPMIKQLGLSQELEAVLGIASKVYKSLD